MDTTATLLQALPFMILISALLLTPLLLRLWLNASTQRREEVQKTIRTLIESGQPLTPEILASLASGAAPHPSDSHDKDLRWGIRLCGIGIAWIFFGLFHEAFDPKSTVDDVMQWVAFSSLLVVSGMMRLALWKFMPRRPQP